MKSLLLALFLVAQAHAEVSVNCREQEPQGFLVRYGMFTRDAQGRKIHPDTNPALKKRFLEKLKPSLLWRFKTYGYPDLPGAKQYIDELKAQGITAHPIKKGLVSTSFLGFNGTFHKKMVPALKCVERDIVQDCMVPSFMCESYDARGFCTKHKEEMYEAKGLSSWRGVDSYNDEEFSNHNFGTAIDIDPVRNPCCGGTCAASWKAHPRCSWPVPHEKKTDLPMCWVNAFKRYGFLWLGEDPDIGDTMHFEYLADPAEI